MESLVKVQKWMKAFKIICTVLLIICIVGGAICVLGVGLGGSHIIPMANIGSINVMGITADASMSAAALRTVLLCAVVSCVFLCVLFGLGAKYLKRELEDGTPFTYDFSKNMKTMAILVLVLPIVSDFITSFIMNVQGFSDSVGTKIDIIPALLLFAISAVFKYGADVLDGGKEDPDYAEN